MLKFNLQNYILPISLMLLAAAILTIRIDKPFMGHHDWASVVDSQAARNFLRYGLIQTKFGQVNNYDLTTPKNFAYITHYPPLLTILMSGYFYLFGVSERSARALPISASIFLVLLIYILGKSVFDRDVAFLAGIFTIITPIFIYFGKMPVHEPVVPAFSLLAFYGYIKMLETQKFKYYFLLLLGFIGGSLVNWTGYYVVVPIAGHYFFLLKDRRFRWQILSLIPISFSLVSLHLLHLNILTGKFLGSGMLAIFLDRFDPSRTQAIYGFTLQKYVLRELLYIRIYFTLILNILAGITFIKVLINSIQKHKVNPGESLILMLVVYGATHLVIFQQLAFIHDYAIYYLLPFISLAAAVTLKQLLKHLPNNWLRRIIIIGLVLGVAFERAAFAKALLDSNMHRRAVALGKFIAKQTKIGEMSLVGSLTYKELTDVYIGFYSDRNVHYAEVIDPTQIPIFRLIIRPKDHDAFDDASHAYLDQHFSRFENESLIWHDSRFKKRIDRIYLLLSVAEDYNIKCEQNLAFESSNAEKPDP